MNRKIASLLIAASLASIPMAMTSGCAVARGRENVKSYAKDKEINTRIKAALLADPTVKGTQVVVNSFQGEVQLSGFVDSQAEKDRAGQIAASVPGVVKVYNNLLLPTGRTGQQQVPPQNQPMPSGSR